MIHNWKLWFSSFYHLHVECNWEPDNNLPYLIDSHLKTAMYFFLQNFSFLEISFTSACIPKDMYNISTGDKKITYDNCCQSNIFTDFFAATEFFFFLLATMSCDWYVAICIPYIMWLSWTTWSVEDSSFVAGWLACWS